MVTTQGVLVDLMSLSFIHEAPNILNPSFIIEHYVSLGKNIEYNLLENWSVLVVHNLIWLTRRDDLRHRLRFIFIVDQ